MKSKMKRAGYLVIGVVAMTLGSVVNSCEIADDLLGNEAVAKLVGEWRCIEEGSLRKSTQDAYTVQISEDFDKIGGVIIDNFYDVNIRVRANVTGKTIIIPNQDTEDNYTVYGSGIISSNSNEITLSYSVDDNSGGAIDELEAVYTKVD